jgi:hypothetical protein
MIERGPLTQQGGQETSNLLHFGMLIVDLDCGHAGQRTLDEITGSSHYCVTTIAGGVGSRDRPRTSSRGTTIPPWGRLRSPIWGVGMRPRLSSEPTGDGK